ncbi:MAG TPA: glycosyltransferase family 4 protein [Candidatus Deferrimicrobiaceae bacterium]|nr:glycosyltransferase family 4 protein [Candidatus Deferrimicrobiaceae bacterium]
MRVLITASAHFAITRDGALWIQNASMGYALWARYLEVFDEVQLLVRARPHAAPPEGWNRASGPGVRAVPVPDSVGPWGFVKDYTRIAGTIRPALAAAEAVMLRVPCHIGGEVWRRLPPRRPYGVEVVADPWDAFSPGAVRHHLRPFFRWWFTRRLRGQCAGACAAAYVTERALQHRYPPGPDTFGTAYSDVELAPESFAAASRTPPPSGARRLVFVGTLAQLYKAPDVLLEALALCAHAGLDVRLTLVGDGKHRPELERRAAALGVSDQVEFRGQLASGELVRRELDRADLFVLPSRQEGLPRAMIEAMARGLPCIGSTVGGIPELLPASDLVPPNDARRLARTIHAVVTDHARMAQMSARNLERAREYSPERLARRRGHFYEHVRIRTQEWLKAKGGER